MHHSHCALLGSALFNSSLFFQGNHLTPDIHVISGPASSSNAKSMLSPPPPYYMPNTKCHPSRPTPNSDSEPVLPPSSPHAHLFPSAQYSKPIHSKNYQLLTPLMFSSLQLWFTPLKIIPIISWKIIYSWPRTHITFH